MKSIGTKRDFTIEYEDLRRSLQGAPTWTKRAAYKEFYRKAAKVADQRLVNLEALSKKKGYKEVTGWAYAQAQRNIRGMFGEDAKRFNRKIPDNLNSIYKDINKVLDFLQSPTSSKSSIDEIYNKRANTINERYGTNIDWSTTGHLFESTLWKKVNSKYGSKTALKAIGQIQLKEKKIKKALKEHKPISITISDNVNVEDTVNKFLRYYKKDITSLLNKI